MTMDEKIQFWREVMQLAKDRGVDVYWFTWNTFLFGVGGKDGSPATRPRPARSSIFAPRPRDIKTYPLLAGFGITAGESMPAESCGIAKEQWLWETYGEGIRDGPKDTPERKFRLIHRFHMTATCEIRKEFAELPCTLDLSYKYANATAPCRPCPHSGPPPSARAAREYTATLGDIEAMAHLGPYYTSKIRKRMRPRRFDKTGGAEQQAAAAWHLGAELNQWKHFSGAYTRQ